MSGVSTGRSAEFANIEIRLDAVSAKSRYVRYAGTHSRTTAVPYLSAGKRGSILRLQASGLTRCCLRVANHYLRAALFGLGGAYA